MIKRQYYFVMRIDDIGRYHSFDITKTSWFSDFEGVLASAYEHSKNYHKLTSVDSIFCLSVSRVR
jgi:hypothetical protein